MKSDDEFTIDRLREDAITWYDPENDEHAEELRAGIGGWHLARPGRMAAVESKGSPVSNETREETVARWKRERPDLAEMSKGDLPLAEIEKLSPTDAYKVGAMVGERSVEVREGG